jgi:hypothetical protein
MLLLQASTGRQFLKNANPNCFERGQADDFEVSGSNRSRYGHMACNAMYAECQACHVHLTSNKPAACQEIRSLSSHSLALLVALSLPPLRSTLACPSLQVRAPGELGPLTELVVGHDNSGQGPSWHLEQVDVTDVRTGQTWYFDCNK